MTTALPLIDRLFELAAHPLDADMTFIEWRAAFERERPPWSNTADKAILGGALSDRVAYAFSGGYQSALNALFPSSIDNKLSAFCVTEEQGNHPKAIQSTLSSADDHWLLNGTKKFITGGCDAERLFVAATTQHDDTQPPSIVMVEIFSCQSGINIQAMPTLPFVPEVSHGTATFENVVVNQGNLCHGDGYDGYIKPFRTIEDTHVSAALLGYITTMAIRLAWEPTFIERCLACLLMHRELASMDSRSSITHLTLAGTQQTAIGLFQEAEPLWEASEPESYARWKRDKSLLGIASTAQLKRKEKAWITMADKAY